MRLKFFLPMLLASFAGLAFASDLVLSAERGQIAYQMLERGDAGAVLNQESGSVPVQRASLRWVRTLGYSQFDLWQGQARIGYLGLNQAGWPLVTQTDLRLQGWQWRLGKSWNWLDRYRFDLATGLDHLALDRQILPTLAAAPLREQLDATRYLLGADVTSDFVTPRPWRLSLGVELLRTLRQSLAVDSFGWYDPIVLHPGASTDWRSRLRLTLALGAASRVWFGVTHEHFKPVASAYENWNRAGTAAALVRYPGSEQSLRSLSLGMSWLF